MEKQPSSFVGNTYKIANSACKKLFFFSCLYDLLACHTDIPQLCTFHTGKSDFKIFIPFPKSCIEAAIRQHASTKTEHKSIFQTARALLRKWRQTIHVTHHKNGHEVTSHNVLQYFFTEHFKKHNTLMTEA